MEVYALVVFVFVLVAVVRRKRVWSGVFAGARSVVALWRLDVAEANLAAVGADVFPAVFLEEVRVQPLLMWPLRLSEAGSASVRALGGACERTGALGAVALLCIAAFVEAVVVAVPEAVGVAVTRSVVAFAGISVAANGVVVAVAAVVQ